MKGTLVQIARKAGVSEDVVLKVINGEDVDATTKRRVLDAISELNYNPEHLDGGLPDVKTNTIAVVTAYMSSFSFYEVYLINGFEKQNSEMGRKYSITQYSTGGSQQRKRELLHAIENENIADGIISMFLQFDKEDLKALKDHGIPVVFIDEEMEGFPCVKMDNFKGAYNAVEYLIKKGKKNIGLVVGQVSSEGVGITPKERFEAYKKALIDHNMPFDEKKVLEIMEYTFEEGEQAMKTLSDRKLGLDAIFCAAGDMVALGIMDEAFKQKIDIPADLALVGYDDINMASLSKPQLTTVRQPIEEIGRTAFKMCAEMVETGKMEPKTVILEPQLIIRGSA
jgi:LacI family transcriptional regulator